MALHPSLLTSAPIPETGPDAALIAACNAFASLEIDLSAPDLTDEQAGAMTPAREAAFDRLFAHRATTLEGFQARARTAAIYLHQPIRCGWNDHVVHLLLRDMLGLPEQAH